MDRWSYAHACTVYYAEPHLDAWRYAKHGRAARAPSRPQLAWHDRPPWLGTQSICRSIESGEDEPQPAPSESPIRPGGPSSPPPLAAAAAARTRAHTRHDPARAIISSQDLDARTHTHVEGPIHPWWIAIGRVQYPPFCRSSKNAKSSLKEATTSCKKASDRCMSHTRYIIWMLHAWAHAIAILAKKKLHLYTIIMRRYIYNILNCIPFWFVYICNIPIVGRFD
jgi:hypothetical protein